MTTVAIHQPEYFPSLRTLHKLASADRIVFLLGSGVMFDRASCQHRARVRGPGGGWRWLTVPYRHVGRYQELAAVEAAVPVADWTRRHFGALRAEYGGEWGWRGDLEPALLRYFGNITDAAYPNARLPSLIALRSIETALLALGWLRPWMTDTDLGVHETDRTARLVACCRALHADTYLSGRTGAAVIDRAQFDRAGVAVKIHAHEPLFGDDGSAEPSVLHPWAVLGRVRLCAMLPEGRVR